MRVFWILTFLCTFYFASGFSARRVRQTDPLTNQLEMKLLRSDLINVAAKKDQKIPNKEGEFVAYGLPHTFIIKQNSPVGTVNILRIRVSHIFIN